MVVGFGRRMMESSRKPHALLLPVFDRRMPLISIVPLQGVSLRVANLFSEIKSTITGNQQSRSKLVKMFGTRRYVRLGSSSQIEALLQADGCAETKYLQFTDDRNADIETIHKRNSVLERKIDDLARKVNDLLSRNSVYEKDNKAEIERMQRKNANLGSEIKQCEKDNKAKLERMERKNANLEAEITILKRKIAALDVKSANSRGMELSATCLTSQLILSEPNDIISPMEMEHQEGSNSSDELAAGMIILIFLISVLIGMQIPTFT